MSDPYVHARASGEVPPEWGRCYDCKQRKEVDWVALPKKAVQLCRACQDKRSKSDEPDKAPEPSDLPF